MADTLRAKPWLQVLAWLAIVSMAFTVLVPATWFAGTLTGIVSLAREAERMAAVQRDGGARPQASVGLYLGLFLILLTQGGWLLRGLLRMRPIARQLGGAAALIGVTAGVAAFFVSGLAETGSTFVIATAFWLTACVVHFVGWLGVAALRLTWRLARTSDVLSALVVAAAISFAAGWWLLGKLVESQVATLRSNAAEKREAVSLGGPPLELPADRIAFDACINAFFANRAMVAEAEREARSAAGSAYGDTVVPDVVWKVCLTAPHGDFRRYFFKALYREARRVADPNVCVIGELPQCPIEEDPYDLTPEQVAVYERALCVLDREDRILWEAWSEGRSWGAIGLRLNIHEDTARQRGKRAKHRVCEEIRRLCPRMSRTVCR